MTRWLGVILLVGMGLAPAWAGPCPEAATLTVVAENTSADPGVTLEVEGQLLAPDATCEGAGVTTYATRVSCQGAGASTCGRITGLRPGAWVHRVRLQVAGSEAQVQRMRSVVLAGVSDIGNVVAWTVYPRTFVVRQATGAALRAALDAAAVFTATRPGRALVIFADGAAPDADLPPVIPLGFTTRTATGDVCEPDATCGAGRPTTYCFSGSRIVVDALDARGRPGGLAISIGKCARSIFRVTGANNVLRGLELRGSGKIDPRIAVDTVAFSGSSSHGNRLEQCIVRGPTRGDAVSVEAGGGSPGGPDRDIAIVRSEITGASDKGVKVTTGGFASIVDSCIHDNVDGGVQATGGGTVMAVRNVLQLQRGGTAQNGLLVGVPNDVVPRNTLVTDGNVVRFSAARGISIVNAATAVLRHDVVSENQAAGIRVEATQPGVVPSAELRGVAVSCNYKAVVGACVEDTQVACLGDADCSQGCAFPSSNGVGVAIGPATALQAPTVDLGGGGRDAGRNVFTQNANPARPVGAGTNLANQVFTLRTVPALGNQWESCGPEARCNVGAVQALDIQPARQPLAADIGTPTGARAGPAPVITRIVPARPRAGEFVRVYNGSLDGIGGTFNAIDGTVCSAPGAAPVGLPGDPCSPENPEIAAQNRTAAAGNRVAIAIGDQQVSADVHAVTPTMLVFRMPVDCFAPATLVVSRGIDAASPPVRLCDARTCADRPAGDPCDDGNVCTVGERCDGQGDCVPAEVASCTGTCLTGVCDPERGCEVAAVDPSCDDGNSCTDDRCVGRGACQSVPLEDGAACTSGDRCIGQERCRAGVCEGGAALSCDDGNGCTDDACDPAGGCQYRAVVGARRTTCLLDEAVAVLQGLPEDGGRLGRRLGASAVRAARWMERADRARTRARARAARGKARAELRRFVRRARQGRRRLGDAVGRRVFNLGKAAIATLRTRDG